MPNPSNASRPDAAQPSFPEKKCSIRTFSLAALTLALLVPAGTTHAQSVAAAAPGPTTAPAAAPIGSLRPALANVQAIVASLNVPRWKVPSATRANVQQDVASMQRDLTATLPGLLVEAEAATGPGVLSPSFAVFRNLDALYDVLLRITETAALANAEADAAGLESARADLEDGRGRLGLWLTQAITAQDARLAQAPAAAAHAAPPASPSKVVVTDGPENTKPRKKKPVTTPQ